jgi:hypothetical protein
MKLNYFILYLLIIGSILLLNSGCEENAKVEREDIAVPASTTEVEKVDPNKPGPRIKFDKNVIDFGEVGPETQSTSEIKISNTGISTLKITKIEECCGVATRLDKYEYSPGESGTLKVIYNSTAEIGEFNKSLYIKSNDNKNPNAKLAVKAKIAPKIACKPELLKLFLNEENAGCEKVTISSLDDKLFAISGVTSTANCITAEFDPTVKAKEFVLEFKVDTEKLENNRKGKIKVSLTHPDSESASISYNVVPKYSVKPQSLILFNAEPEKPIKKSIKIINNYTDDFEIDSTGSKDNTIKTVNISKIENGYNLDIEITPQAKEEGEIRFSDVFYINIKGAKRLEVSCTGYYARG